MHVNGVAVIMPFPQLLQINGVLSVDIIYTLQSKKCIKDKKCAKYLIIEKYDLKYL